VQATSPLAVMALAWLLIHEKPTLVRLGASLVGLVGVTLLVLRSPEGVDAVGLLAAAGSVVVSGLGFVLVKRWRAAAPGSEQVPMLTLISWQLVVGGLLLLPVGLVVEGAPPTLDAQALGGFLWLGGVGTVLAYFCWFRGLSLLPAGSVALVGLLNPVVGTVLGVAIAGELFGWAQALGMALVIGGVVGGQLRRPLRVRPAAVTCPRPPRPLDASMVSRSGP